MPFPVIKDTSQFCKYILDFAASLRNPDKDKIFSYLFNQDDGIRSELLAEYIRRNDPSPELYDLFLMLYTITDYSAGVHDADLLRKLASGRSSEQIRTKFVTFLLPLPIQPDTFGIGRQLIQLVWDLGIRKIGVNGRTAQSCYFHDLTDFHTIVIQLRYLA